MASQVGRFSKVIQLSLRACEALAPLVRELYQSADELVELKADKSAFTIADGLVQQLLKENLFKGRTYFKAIVGEEDGCDINLSTPPYSVSNLKIPESLYPRLSETVDSIDTLAQSFWSEAVSEEYRDCSVFVDPIDGTREFSTGKGEQCTILIGFATQGQPRAGVVFRPIEQPSSWAIGCKEEGLFQIQSSTSDKTTSTKPNPKGLLTTNGDVSPFLQALADGLHASFGGQGDTRVTAGGVGNKLLNLMEGKGMCYISDRGVSRWDTCAAQAVLESQGGFLIKLFPFIKSKSLESYRYEETSVNLDFDVQANVQLTKHNSKASMSDASQVVRDVTELKAYANVLGLLVLDKNGVEHLDTFYDICTRAAQEFAPTFN